MQRLLKAAAFRAPRMARGMGGGHGHATPQVRYHPPPPALKINPLGLPVGPTWIILFAFWAIWAKKSPFFQMFQNRPGGRSWFPTWFGTPQTPSKEPNFAGKLHT